MESANSIPKQLGDFEILRELGRGGMGVVYEARQKSLNRRVALKVLSSGLGLTAKAVMRFRREAEAAAKLHHTNIVPIYSTGEESGIHYYAMELIEGPSLDQVIRYMRDGIGFNLNQESDAESTREASSALPDWVDKTIAYDSPKAGTASSSGSDSSNSLTDSDTVSNAKYFDSVATMIADVADALQHAHDEGVIHRDVKPSNLLLAPDGRLSINDFGLARVLEQPGMTMSGEFVGTPRYMSPEQITAGRAPLDHRTDIYSLGATLYELVTLGPPFPGTTRDGVIAQILHKEPKLPRRLNRKIPADLQTIVLKAIEKDPDCRYQTAGQMANDLRRFVNRHTIEARRASVLGRLVKVARRHPALTVSYSLLVILALVLLSVTYLFWQRELDRAIERTTDTAMRGRFPEAREHLEWFESHWGSKAWIRTLEGQIAMHEGNFGRAELLLQEAQELMPNNPRVYALLTIVHFLAGNEDEYCRRLPALRDLQPKDFYDKLFKGYAETWLLPEQSLQDLRDAVAERNDNPAGNAVLARSLLINGMMKPSAAEGLLQLHEALQKLDYARQSWPNTPWLLNEYVHINIALTKWYRELEDEQQAEESLDRAREGVGQLRTLPDSYEIVFSFLGLTDEKEQLTECVRNRLTTGLEFEGYSAVNAASHLYRLGEKELALTCFAQAPERMRIMCEWQSVFMRMDAHDADPQELCDQFLNGLDRRMTEYSGIYLTLDWPALRLLGVPKEDPRMIKIANMIEDCMRENLLEHKKLGVALPQFMRGEINADALLNVAESKRDRALWAHFIIGVDYLAMGKRKRAQEQFQQGVDTNFYFYHEYRWSRTFLERANDPKWLPWLPNDDKPQHPEY